MEKTDIVHEGTNNVSATIEFGGRHYACSGIIEREDDGSSMRVSLVEATDRENGKSVTNLGTLERFEKFVETAMTEGA